jgi:CRP/FNR family transcriptional regulator, nitrogen oxide reductase regulator
MAAVDRSIVANIPIFAGLGARELDEILGDARSVRYPKGTSAFDQGAEAHSFFFCCTAICEWKRARPRGSRS